MVDLPTTYPLLLTILIVSCLLGGFVKGISGSGLPQIAVPMVALVSDVPTAIALVQLPAMSINLLQLRPAGYPVVTVAQHWPVVLVLLVSTVVGISFLKVAPPALLFGFMGMLTLAATAFLAVKPTFTIAPALRLPVGMPLAFGAGISSGMSSLAGPFLIPYFMSLKLPKDVFVASISFCYLAIILPTIVLFIAWDVVDPRLFLVSLIAVPPSLAGMWIGNLARRWINETWFRQMILAFLTASGVALLVKAAIG